MRDFDGLKSHVERAFSAAVQTCRLAIRKALVVCAPPLPPLAPTSMARSSSSGASPRPAVAPPPTRARPSSEVVALVRAAADGSANAQYNLGLSILSGDDGTGDANPLATTSVGVAGGVADPKKVRT